MRARGARGRRNCRPAGRSRSARGTSTVAARVLQQLHRREADRGADQVDEAGDEQADARSGPLHGQFGLMRSDHLKRLREATQIGRRYEADGASPQRRRRCKTWWRYRSVYVMRRLIRQASHGPPPALAGENGAEAGSAAMTASPCPIPTRRSSPAATQILAGLAPLVAGEALIIDGGRAPRLRDRRRSPPTAACRSPWCCPRRPTEVSAVMRYLPRRTACKVVARGAGTSLAGGAHPAGGRDRARRRQDEPGARGRLRATAPRGSSPASPTSASPAPSRTRASSTRPTRRASSPARSRATSR